MVEKRWDREPASVDRWWFVWTGINANRTSNRDTQIGFVHHVRSPPR
jgi:hypothetical protein